MSHFDLVVIGGGSGGSACARRAAGYGKKVCLVERGVKYVDGVRQGAGVGGTCVNVGCVPKKIMFMAAYHKELIDGPTATMNGFGFKMPGGLDFDWAALKAKRDAYVARLNVMYKNNWNKAGIDVREGFASFSGPKEVTITKEDGTTETVTGEHVLIAAGGVPAYPPLKGAELCITSDGFFDVEQQPKKAAVIGAGYIAVEMAGIMQALGTSTSLFFRGDTVLRHGFDPFIVEHLMDSLKHHGPALHSNSKIDSIRLDDDGTKSIVMKDGTAISGFDCVLLAIGRKPATEGLGLEKLNMETERGHIKVDQYENTSVPGIVALGDITTTGWQLTPVAIAAGRRLSDRLFGGEPKARIEYETIPTVVFSHPPIGVVGLTEPAAIEKYGAANVKTKKAAFASMFYAFNDADHKTKTGLKLVLAGDEERVVGLHLIGPQVDEILQGFSVAIRMGATRKDFEACVAIHPTVAEEIVTFGGWGQKDGKPLLAPYLTNATNVPEAAVPAEKEPEAQDDEPKTGEITPCSAPACGFSCGLLVGVAAAAVVAFVLAKKLPK